MPTSAPSLAAIRAVARAGLPRHAGPPKRIVVVGAGMAGLVAALECRRAGHRVLVLEARARVGGRIHTLREPSPTGCTPRSGRCGSPAVTT